jgi:hypothetical protein
MKCVRCHNAIGNVRISAAENDFCSEGCHLRFWKEEMPNRGGECITEEDVVRVEMLEGEDRKNEHTKIIQRVMENFDIIDLTISIRYWTTARK